MRRAAGGALQSAFPDGTLLEEVCPKSCAACPCNPPWCYTAAAIEAIHNATNATEVAIAYERQQLQSLHPLLAALHGVEPYRLDLLRFHNDTQTVRENIVSPPTPQASPPKIWIPTSAPEPVDDSETAGQQVTRAGACWHDRSTT